MNLFENTIIGFEYFAQITSFYAELNIHCQWDQKITERKCSEEQIKAGCFDLNIESENSINKKKKS